MLDDGFRFNYGEVFMVLVRKAEKDIKLFEQNSERNLVRLRAS